MGYSAILLGFSWLVLMNGFGFAAVLPLNHMVENSIEESTFKGSEKNTELKDWVVVKATSSETIRVPAGGRVELECTVLGSPLPQAQWTRGLQLNQITVGPNEFEDSGEFQSIGKMTVRHVIDCVQPHHQGIYTCIGQARGQTMASDPVAVSVEGRAVQCSKGKIRISKWSPIITQLIGTSVVIPCEVTDSSGPYRKYWKDNFGNVIDTDIDPRRKSGPEGELIMNNLSWSDMGEYTCVVENSISRDSSSTFLYPMLSSA